jgi:hypothetical protein
MQLLKASDRAKYVREKLKEKFPKIKFGVRASSYSMGSNVSVHWTDGPTEKAVKDVIDCLTEEVLKLHDINLDTKYNGISFTREISKETWGNIEAEVLKEMTESNDPYITDEWTVKRRVSYELEERSFL